MMIKLDEAMLTTQQALWVVFSRGKLVVQESSESIPVAYLPELPFLTSYISDIHQLPPLNETAQRDLPVFVVDLGAEHIDEPGWERVSLCFTWFRLASLELTWLQLASLVFTWLQLVSPGFV